MLKFYSTTTTTTTTTMKICIFQSSYTNPHPTQEFDPGVDPSTFTDQHNFHHVWVHKETAKEHIDAAISTGYDFYFNFMWGQHEDEVAGIDACKYFESFGLPSIGQRSEVLERCKNGFYKSARTLGYPRVPGTSKSLCHNRKELVECLANIKEALVHGRSIAGRSEDAAATAPVVDGIPIPDDIVVQEYIYGWDHSVVIIEVGDCPVPLAPECYVYPAEFKPYEEFLTFDVKFHPDTRVELLRREDNPTLFTKLQEIAIQAFHANKMAGQSWCSVDIRVPELGQGEPIVLEVNPMPTVFLPREHEWEELAVRECFPGRHRALVNTLIASSRRWRHSRNMDQEHVANVYDAFSAYYDENVTSLTQIPTIYSKVLACMDLSHGAILELGAGTGLFGRGLAHAMQCRTPPTDDTPIPVKPMSLRASGCHTFSLTGIELSKGMVRKCRDTGVYGKVYHGPVETILSTIGPFDHIVSFSHLYFLPPVDFSLVMVRSFQLARQSLVVSIDEIPDNYNSRLVDMGPPHSHMIGYNHLADMEKSFCDPPPAGWKLSKKFRQFAWNSPKTRVDVYMTVYCFEREV